MARSALRALVRSSRVALWRDCSADRAVCAALWSLCQPLEEARLLTAHLAREAEADASFSAAVFAASARSNDVCSREKSYVRVRCLAAIDSRSAMSSCTRVISSTLRRSAPKTDLTRSKHVP